MSIYRVVGDGEIEILVVRKLFVLALRIGF